MQISYGLPLCEDGAGRPKCPKFWILVVPLFFIPIRLRRVVASGFVVSRQLARAGMTIAHHHNRVHMQLLGSRQVEETT